MTLQIPYESGEGFDVPIQPVSPMGESAVLLDVDYISQHPTNNLCWAACCEMVLRANGNTNISMCRLAGNNCCPTPTGSVCDKEIVIENVSGLYQKYGFSCDAPYSYPFTWVGLVNEIGTSHRPVQAYLKWDNTPNSGGHLVLLIGIFSNRNNQLVFVNDPWLGWGWVKYRDVLTAYNQGRWVQTWQNIGYSLGTVN